MPGFAEIAVKHPRTPLTPGRKGIFDLQPRFFIFRVNKKAENYLFKSFYFSIFVELLNKLTMAIKNTIPTRVTPYGKRLDAASSLRKDITMLKVAVFNLRTIPELPAQEVASLDGFTHEWVANNITPHIDAVKADVGLTEGQRATRLKEWHNIFLKARKEVDTIMEVTTHWHTFTWNYDPKSGNVSYTDNDFDRVINDAASLDVPDAAATHWAKLQTIIQAVKELRQWEAEQDILPYRIADAVDASPVVFAEQWATSAFRIDHRYDKYRPVNNKLIV